MVGCPIRRASRWSPPDLTPGVWFLLFLVLNPVRGGGKGEHLDVPPGRLDGAEHPQSIGDTLSGLAQPLDRHYHVPGRDIAAAGAVVDQALERNRRDVVGALG